MRVLVAVIAGLLLLSLVGAVSQAVAMSRDRRAYPPPGEMINVAGHRLHLHCTGYGSPTVILEAGNLGMSAHWVRVQQEIAPMTRVCSYDRAGMGWSDAESGSRDARRISAELHTLLSSAIGIIRLTHFLPGQPELPPQQYAEVGAFNSSTRQVTTSAQEFRATPITCNQARGTRSLGDKPLAVITAGDQPPDWLQMQNGLAALSSNIIHTIAGGTTHASLLFSERGAILSSAAIAQVVTSVRIGQPLNH